MKKLPYACLGLFLFSFAALSAENNSGNRANSIEQNKETNTSIKDPRVPNQYLPVAQSNVGDSKGITFIDRTTVKLHPYNPLIRTYTEITTYGPYLEMVKGDTTVPYRSMVVDYYVNCDKMEYGRGTVMTYEGYFASGELQNTNNNPKRWQETAKGTPERRKLIIACSLPLQDEAQ